MFLPVCTAFTVPAPAYIRLLGPGQFQISLDYPGSGIYTTPRPHPISNFIGLPRLRQNWACPGPAIILLPVDHWCFDDPDIINIGDSRKFHTFDEKTVKSVKGYLCFLSKKFYPLKFFCSVHHSSPVNAWVWVVKSKRYFPCIL